MAAPIEVVLTCDLSGQMWNTCVWDLNSGTVLKSYSGGISTSKSLNFIGRDYLLSASPSKSVLNLWSLHKREQQQVKMICPGVVNCLTVSPDGSYCVAAISEKIYIWQFSTGNLLAVVSRHYQKVTCLSFTDDGSHFVSGGEDNIIIVWSMASLLQKSNTYQQCIEPLHIWSQHSLPITDVYCGTGFPHSRVVSTSLDQTCKLWDMASGELLQNFVFDVPLHSVVMDSAEYRLFVGGADGNIFQLNLFSNPCKVDSDNKQETPDIFKGHSNKVTCLSVSMDGSRLVSGSHDNTARIWDVSSRQCVRTLKHKGPVSNTVIKVPPRKMFSALNKSGLPIKPFKRHVHVPATGSKVGNQTSRESVQIRTRHSFTSTNYTDSIEPLVELVKKDDKVYSQLPAETNQELQKVKKLNEELYTFTIKQLVQ
ncbi:WD repeat-containing protein 18-like [Antedon mediterranea]|uniref:WD repeat-containing protein 18-like n=1 Tax=Antedon mediterranea TaxID=105859 RepID=UPI003AF78BC1